jgi:hypothetical protein
MNIGPTLGTRTSTFSTPTTAPPSQNAHTIASMQVARVQLAMTAQLPSLKFYATTPPPVSTATTRESRAAAAPTGAFALPGTSIGPRGTTPGRTSGTTGTVAEQTPAAPSEVVGDIAQSLQEAGTAAAASDDPVVPTATTTAAAAQPSSISTGSKILIGAGIVLGGILVFRFLK